LVLHLPFKAYKEILQECLVVAGVDEQVRLLPHLISTRTKNRGYLKEVVNVDEELKQQELEVKERRAKKNRAVENFLRTDPRLECVRKHRDKKRQRKRRK